MLVEIAGLLWTVEMETGTLGKTGPAGVGMVMVVAMGAVGVVGVGVIAEDSRVGVVGETSARMEVT